MKRKFNKTVVAHYSTKLDGRNFQCVVVKDREWFNIHIIDDIFQQDEMNTLKLQEPEEYVSAESFTDNVLLQYIIEHFVWWKYYKEGFVVESLTIVKDEVE
ncbi:hypothetical protein M316_0039 [Nitrincola phage 1M3-16]|uniref:hypothetical protein n=1 Tax=Nitrincola phage 1M3-16 TaxID=1472912 RepID=UPI000444B21F|nr:hypothetical protein GJ22_gp113 [Nitrincola phage 1M3-16]AHX01104.1 hypothetical protein M316_0039 [Nitrincola phage 1M3-16]